MRIRKNAKDLTANEKKELIKAFKALVSVRKVVESYEPDVIQESYHRMEDKTDVDIRKPWFL